MRKLLYFLLIAVACPLASIGRELVTNGTFNNGTANWTTGCTNVEADYFESTYGGVSTTNHVAEIDDESCFYQNVCVLPGSNYILSLLASRRTIAAATIISHIKVEGLNAANTIVGLPLVDMDFTRTNTTFTLTPVTGIPVITVPAGSGIVRLKIAFTDNTAGVATLGMIIDDVSLVFETPPIFNTDSATCVGTLTPMSLGNLAPTGVNYVWTLTGGIPATSTLANPSATWATAATYPVSCALSNGTCPVDTVRVNVTVGTIGLPTVVSPLNYCTGQAAPALTATGTTLRWYTAPNGGTPLPAAPTPPTTTPGSTTWYVSQAAGICESGRVPITVNVNQVVMPAFTYAIKYGCTADTVIFTNQSTGGATYQWNFGDNSNGSMQFSPTHTYSSQNIFAVKLIGTSGFCSDSITHNVDLVHPLQATFVTSGDTICQNKSVTFTNTSTTTTRNGINPTYTWNFGDGSTSTDQHPVHTYTTTGVFKVLMTVTDFVPCQDTETRYIFVDTAAGLTFTVTDTVICQGETVSLTADYTTIGFRNLTWSFGDDASTYSGTPIQHAYDSAGIFTIKVTADYRVCPDTTLSQNIRVKPFPVVNLGRDTFMCPNAAPFALIDAQNAGNPAATWLWNTGAITPGITVNEPGTFSTTVSMDGCTTTDSITIWKDCYVDIPNSFTPNGDGLNDYFFPRTTLSHAVTQFNLQIFNRWGQIIFETKNTDGRGWDGKFNDSVQPQGVYIYLMEVSFSNGIHESYKGNVSLLR